MSAPLVPVLLAGFPRPEPLRAAAKSARESGLRPLDAFTPLPVEGLAEVIGFKAQGVRTIMLAAGLTVAAGLYLTEWWSATQGYPFNTGGRPLHSWPAFLVAPVELGILAAGIGGFVTLLVKAGLPRLNHPLFDRLAFERASQDQFVLAIARPDGAEAAGRARQALFDDGASWVEEAEL